MTDADADYFSIPPYFTEAPLIRDSLTTVTSSLQEETIRECLPFLNAAEDPARSPFDFNEHGVPRLNREDHIVFLKNSLAVHPSQFVGVDASRPWMVYWALIGLYLLGEDVTSYRSRVVATFSPMQNKSGGLGGGQGQYSHLAGTYAALLCIALVGGSETYDLIDRESMWHWLGRLKQSNGGFQICEGGETDVRPAYCALVVISLLNLPFSLPPEAAAREAGFETFGDGLGEYISRCQTYEGGISAEPGGEAHGAYAFCVLACLCLLDEPHKAMERYLDIPALLNWLSSRQYAPEGGFAGRTNKLVDGCYSHWIGGCWPLLQAALDGPQAADQMGPPVSVGNLYSTEGLTRYILNCCQAKSGGLRDKPSRHPDSYHTCYTLAGLSAIQHIQHFGFAHSQGFASAFTWKATALQARKQGELNGLVSDEADQVQPLHPVYVISQDAVMSLRRWAIGQPGIA